MSRAEGCLLGILVGDALGLPREGLSARKAARRFGTEPRHALLPLVGRGMASDDFQHAAMTSQALLASQGDSKTFARSLGWRLRWWLLGLPAGVGFATLRACVKLWLGFSPERSGVWSAGNGPAMRAPILGVLLGDDETKLREFVRASTLLTHRDPKAELGAMAVALMARRAAASDPATFSAEALFEELRALLADDPDALAWLDLVQRALAEDWDIDRFRRELTGGDWGVSGYIYRTVPAVLWAWLKGPFDFAGGLKRVLALGGDADTTGAIFGGICGAAVGAEGIPREWIAGVWEFPCSPAWTRRLAERLELFQEGEPVKPLGKFWPLILVRNAIFLAVVLAHGLRRLLPWP
jgi:ADP-ribosyl-[dinitrogen reductase] hydrolase